MQTQQRALTAEPASIVDRPRRSNWRGPSEAPRRPPDNAQPVFAPSGVAGALAPAAGAGVALAASAGGAAGCAPSPAGATTLPLFHEAMMISVARVDSAPPGSHKFSLSSFPEAIASEYSRQ